MLPEPIKKEELPQGRQIELNEVQKESKTAEKEIAELERLLNQKKSELLRREQERQNKKESASEFIPESAKSTASPSALQDNQSPANQPTDSVRDFSGEEKIKLHQLKKMDKKSQLEFLVKLSFEKGLDEAVKLARALDNSYLIDEFHDQLVDQFYKQLVKTGKLENL